MCGTDGLWACTPNTGGSGGGTGGTEESGGSDNSGGAGGPGGSDNSGGTGNTSTASGGESTGGGETGGESSGGAPTGGTPPGGGTGPGECVTGQTSGNEVVFIGESFIAMSSIPETVSAHAQAAGALAQNDRYLDQSVSGTTLANNQIPSQYTQAQASNDIRFVLMDGGGNDCLLSNNSAGALSAATSLLETMGQDGVEAVLYFFYPDPIGGNYTSLKSCLDTLRPQMQALCEGLTAPKCYWLDLRTVWNGHNEYTSDGIHPTESGSKATGDAIWEAMVEHCIAQ